MAAGYTVVDVDEDESGGLQFKTFLNDAPSSSSGGIGSSNNNNRADRERPDVPYSVFNLAYYQTYFDVDTIPVLKRVGMAMIPRGGFIADACEGHVDLYGESSESASRLGTFSTGP
jgi:hypothetical protein